MTDSHQSSSAASAASHPSYNDTFSSAPQLCRFFLEGKCRFRENCHFSHTLPDNMTLEQARQQVPCPFYQQGNCRYGDKCHLGHFLEVSSPPKEEETEEESTTTCGICLEDIQGGNRRFGLLVNCPHCFCLSCLRQWRATKDASPSENHKSCPTCRARSDFIIPSKHYCVGTEKDRVLQNYKAHMATMPCKRFNGTLGSCPFGPDCFYAHRGPEGQDLKPDDFKRRRRRRRHIGGGLFGTFGEDIDYVHTMLHILSLYDLALGSEYGWEDSDYDSSSTSESEASSSSSEVSV